MVGSGLGCYLGCLHPVSPSLRWGLTFASIQLPANEHLWEAGDDDATAWVLAIHLGDLDGVPAS